MTPAEWCLLLAAGLAAGIINSVSSGGSFFTYPALLLVGLTPIQAATSTFAALTPANLAAVPEYWPEVKATRHRYREVVMTVLVGGLGGIALLLSTRPAVFESLVPWLILLATASFAASPALRRWAATNSPSLTEGRLGVVMLLVLAVYLTYFGSGAGNMFLAALTIRGFDDFLSANAAKNIAMTLGSMMATIAYTVAGHVQWWPCVPLLIGSSLGGALGGRIARSMPLRALRVLIIAFGLFVAGWQFLR